MSKEEEDAWVSTIENEDEELAMQKLRKYQYPQTATFFEAPSGNRLHARIVLPPGDTSAKSAQAVLLYCHGLNSHVNLKHWVDHLTTLASQKLIVVGVDIMGHGYSEGERCMVEDWHDVFNDLESFLETFMGVSAPIPDAQDFGAGISHEALLHSRSLPIFVSGNSMGGMIAMYVGLALQTNVHLQSKFRGAILGYPALAVPLPSPAVQAVLRNVVVPLFKSHQMPKAVSSSSEVRLGWGYDLSDPKLREIAAMDIRDCGYKFPGQGLGWRAGMRWGTASAFSTIFSRIEEDMKDVSYPFLLIHDPGDRICLVEGSEKLLQVSPSTDKTFKKLDRGGYHSLALMAEQEFVAYVVSWIQGHL